jgi:hypothetical protein
VLEDQRNRLTVNRPPQGPIRRAYRLAACLAALILPNGCPLLLLVVIAGDQIAALAVTFGPDRLR